MMSCCGNKRAAFAQGQTVGAASRTMTPVSTKMWTDLRIINTGEPAVSAIGSLTGKYYRWTGKDDIQVVDYRDAGTLRYQLPALKRVK